MQKLQKKEIHKNKKAGNRIIKLTSRQRKKLVEAEKEESKPQLLKRIQSILLKDRGWTHQEIADHLGVGVSVIGHWVEIYLSGGLSQLLHWGYCGKKSRLTLEQIGEIKAEIRKKPFAIAQEAVDFIKEKFKIDYNVRYMPRLLKKTLYPAKNPV